jgi:hypothetical protein
MNYSKLAKFLLEGHGCVDCDKSGGTLEEKKICLIKQGTPERGHCKFWNLPIQWPRPGAKKI